MTDQAEFLRYGVYLAPSASLGVQGAAWLGWDVFQGTDVSQPAGLGVDLDGLTQRPRRYGFHATIKPPFQLADDATEADLRLALAKLVGGLLAIQIGALQPSWIGRFLALVPRDDDASLRPIADSVVAGLDRFRAPMTPEERVRRSHRGMSDVQQTYLERWGYPHVFDAFQCHLTLTGPVSKSQRGAVEHAARVHFADTLGTALPATELALVGESHNGRFRVIETFALGGPLPG